AKSPQESRRRCSCRAAQSRVARSSRHEGMQEFVGCAVESIETADRGGNDNRPPKLSPAPRSVFPAGLEERAFNPLAQTGAGRNPPIRGVPGIGVAIVKSRVTAGLIQDRPLDI